MRLLLGSHGIFYALAVLGIVGVSVPARAETRIALAPLRGIRRIVFLGDSITYAGGYVEALDAWLFRHDPGHPRDLINVGLPSENVSGLTEPDHAGGAFPRPDLHERLDRVLEQTKPDLVVACYGMNDGIYYPYSDDRFARFEQGMRHLAERVRRARARLWVLTPPPFDPTPIRSQTLPDGRASYPSGSPFEGYDGVLARYADWLRSAAAEEWRVIDIHTPLNAYVADRRRSHPGYTMAADGVHLDATGHRLIAREVLRAWGAPADTLPSPDAVRPGPVDALIHERQRMLTDAWLTATGHRRPGLPQGCPLQETEPRSADLAASIRDSLAYPPFAGTVGDYHGFPRHDFTVDGRPAIVVAPHAVRPGRPWIWRAEFFDHRPELDLALLARGYHLVYIDVGNTFGAPSAMKHWDALYALLTRSYGFSRRPVLEGLSRGGLYVYNWGTAHPRSVGVIVGDNPVCDFKSWPGGKGRGPGSPDDWRKLQSDYGFASERAALAYRGNPIDRLAPLAKAGVPIIHLCGDADEVVPYDENTVVLRERYERLGGYIEVIVKPGFKHHPHGLDDPTPLVQFIEAHLDARARPAGNRDAAGPVLTPGIDP